ncbi:ATP-binding protein [Patescibacteria group bacterium]|nr:ATP-binding protein [Patescibacteria group bacterium]MBU4017387.1 ATP-binding protein [Patescibacteria group bacterium]
MIPRLLEKHLITDLLKDSKTIIVLGARQVGKTTLVKDIQSKIASVDTKILYLNCDIDEERDVINTTSLAVLGQLLQNIDLLFIDEAQRLANPGLTMKIIHENFSNIRVLATGSSSLDLQNKMSDAMTGRTFEFKLFPLSFVEALAAGTESGISQNIQLRKQGADAILPSVLTYGLYPEVYIEGDPVRKQRILTAITKDYLLKDVLTYQGVKNSQAIQDLTRALAYQIGSEVNENELSKRLGIDNKTVARYIDILEKTFVVIRLTPYSKNLRREIGGKYKVYFTDLGIRNALIGDFNTLNVRNDLGAIWENFLILERMKAYANKNQGLAHYNFWRSYDGAEVDYVEKSYTDALSAYEFKYQGNALSRGAYSFTNAYQTKVKLINKDNYLDFLSGA